MATTTPNRRLRLSQVRGPSSAVMSPERVSLSGDHQPPGSASIASFPAGRSSDNSTPFDALAIAFWGSKLRLAAYQDGDPTVEFQSLWPGKRDLTTAVEEFRQSDLEYAVLDCCRLVVLCGPVRVLHALLAAKIVSVDQMFQPHGVTLMHMACVAQLPDMVRMLKEFKPANKLDLLNRRPQDICQDKATRDCLSAVQRVGGAIKRVQNRAPSAVAKDLAKNELFQMAVEPMKCVELLIQIQKLDFALDSEKDEDGNFVVHLATACGIEQVPTLLCMHRLHKPNFEIYNVDGMTPLCIAAQNGCLFLVELLICVIGVSPNTPNKENGWTPLHFAASQCHTDVVIALLRRGALVNMECKIGSLPDDVIPRDSAIYRETMQLFESERSERMDRLTAKAQAGALHWNDIHQSDQYVINDAGNTMLMEAVLYNQTSVVRLLCDLENAPINAQHFKTGQTATAMCAVGGHTSSLIELLQHGADPRISDMDGMRALHHACRYRQIDCVMELIKPKLGLDGLSSARKYTNDIQVLAILDAAQKRRQEEVIKPRLFESVASGDIELIGAFNWDEGEDDVNVMNSYDEWPLLLAAQNGHDQIVRMLHKLGGFVNRKHKDSGITPLHAACRGGHNATVDFLLNFTISRPNSAASTTTSSTQKSPPAAVTTITAASGVESEPLLDINSRDNSGHTPIELAVAQGHTKIIEKLCEHGASCIIPDSSGNLLSSRQFMGVQVMLKRYRQQHLDEIVVTFSRKKDLPLLKSVWVSPHDHLLRNESGESPLMIACSSMAPMPIIAFLLADIKSEAARPVLNGSTSNMQLFTTPKRSASLSGTIMSPPDSNGRTRRRSVTPLMPSQRASLADRERRLTRRSHTSLDTVASPYRPLTMSTITDEEEASPRARRRLFDAQDRSSSSSSGSDKTTTVAGFGGSSPQLNQVEEQMDELLGNGPQQEPLSCSESDLSSSAHSMTDMPWREPRNNMLLVQSRDGQTALHCAIRASFSKAVSALIDADARIINVADYLGNTPLHLACALKQNKIIKELLKWPTLALNLRNTRGQMAEDVAPKGLVKAIASRRAKMPQPEIPSPLASDNVANLPSPPAGDALDVAEPGAIAGANSLEFEVLERQFLELKAGKAPNGALTPQP